MNLKRDKPFIIAEISANHGGELENCLKLIEIAKKLGADAVKFQSYSGDTITLDSSKKDFLLPDESPWGNYKNLYNLYESAKTPLNWFPELLKFANEINILALSSVFSEKEVDYLQTLNISAYKVASPEINNSTLIKKIASTNKPIILSLGVASKQDLDNALKVIREISNNLIVVMQCDTSYPGLPENCNLALLDELKEIPEVILGYSDHTITNVSAIVAVAKGARIFEKHLKLDSIGETPDSFFSASEAQFASYVKEIHLAYASIGEAKFRHNADDQISHVSIYPVRKISKGTLFTNDNLKIIRPGLSLHPKYISNLIGSVAKFDYEPGDRIRLEEIS
jgi:sialic acid synthase SpsE